MDEQFKQRLVGASVLVLLAVIFIPMILDSPSEPEVRVEHPTLPARTEPDFSSRIVPLTEPKTTLVEVDPTGPRVVPKSDPPKAAVPAEPTRTVTAGITTPPEEKKSAPAPVPEPAPEATTAEDAPKAWAIQLGSFSSAKNAMALRDKLKKLGYVAFIETARVEGKDITRVFVGPELAKERAGELVKKLQAETDLKGMVVQYPES